MALAGTNFKLRSDAEKDTYNSVKLTTTADRVAGAMLKKNDCVGVFVRTASSGYDVAFVYEASKILVPCVAITSGTEDSYAILEKVYYDETNAEVTVESSGNTLCGVITYPGASGDETLEIHLMGALGITS